MTAKAAQKPVDDPRLGQRARLQAERERVRRAGELPKRPPPGVTWASTPSQGENDLLARGNLPLVKCWDRSPVDPQSFDPSEPPPLPAMPSNAAPPFVTELTDLVVGSLLVVSNGAWTGGPIYGRQWRRNGAAIWGATAISYTLSYLDIGSRISATVRATNAGGSLSVDSNEVGPVVP